MSKGVAQTKAVAAIKDAVPELVVMTDVCVDEYTDHGHCGILTAEGEVDNDATLEVLALSLIHISEPTRPY